MNTRRYAPIVALGLLAMLPACGFRLPKPEPGDSEVIIQQNDEPSIQELEGALAVLGVHVKSMAYETAHGGGTLELKSVLYQHGQLVKEDDGSSLSDERAGENSLTLFTRDDAGVFSAYVQLNGSRVSVGSFKTLERMNATAFGGPSHMTLEEEDWTQIYCRYADEDGISSAISYSIDELVAQYDEVIAVMVKRTPAAK